MTTTPEHLPARLAVAAEVRSLMGRHQVSQTSLATTLGMSQPSLSKRLTGEVAFDMDELIGIAARFDVGVMELFSGVEQGGSQMRWIPTPTFGSDSDISVTQCEGQRVLALTA